MSEKRKRDADSGLEVEHKANKKQKRGFTVGPQYLPDGTYRRKTQKIKSDLIKKAKIKKDYAKLKRNVNNLDEHQDQLPQPATRDEVLDKHDPGPEPSKSPHPDRQAMMDSHESPQPSDQSQAPKSDASKDPRNRHRERKPKHQPFQAEYTAAQKRKAEAESRRKEREEAERQRQGKLEERERFRKAMAKARTGGKNGQRKLGRESKVLLERVKRMTGPS